MPNIKSAEKRVRQSVSKTAINKHSKSELKTVLKNAHQALDTSADDAAQKALKAQKKIDNAASKGLIHKNKAARKNSQIAKKLNQLG